MLLLMIGFFKSPTNKGYDLVWQERKFIFVGPYRMLRRIGKVAYELELHIEIDMVHLVFHVSMLRGYVGVPSAIGLSEVVGVVEDELTYEEVRWRSWMDMSKMVD